MPGTAKQAARSRELGWLGRAGLVAKGISFGLVAVLAIGVAIGAGGKTTDRQGALRTLSHHAYGKVLLIALAVGFGGYALWRLAEAFLDRRGEGGGAKALLKRAGFLARGLVYAALCVTAVSILVGRGGGGGGQSQDRATAGVLGWWHGRWIVYAVAAGIAAAALWNAFRAITGKFRKNMRTEEMSKREKQILNAVGFAGHLARAIVFGIAAWFLARAAHDYRPSEAVGLDGALSKLAHESYGSVLLGITASGLLAYGVFCLFQARYRKV